ncbi:stage VI sporulation protein D [Falsibacillus albus]|uniref:Stage VI sporulation protein D n=1 Tax=Falsibacillus albus TaxID=2478915 RepID=A0A3L7K4N2_9BACI|nr:stage VI sporulation protein D [Falsibacillus albus]RLQ98036.1 stage VI sporulation protein D [Falsibacillus albus]
MSESQQSFLRFSLEESVWFKKGQEVEELLSISLDPFISIQEQEQYVLIRGNLELTGEYKLEASEEVEVFQQAGKYMDEVELREDGNGGFKHHFPVDITIPKNRIQEMEQIDVAVETFDYVLPEKGCLKLTADLKISGIYGEQQTKIEQEVEEAEFEPMYRTTAVEVEEEQEQDQAVFQYSGEMEEEHDEEDYEEPSFYSPFSAEARKPSVPDQEKDEEVPVQIHYDMNELPYNQSEEDRFAESNPVFQMPEPEVNESSSSSSSSYYDHGHQAQPQEMDHGHAHPYEQEEEEQQPVKGKKQDADKKAKKKKDQGISLADFFARKEEERAAKLKVCIVQQGDTLDLLAEKYDISVQQLLRVNDLEMNQDVYEGQVLYIPESFVFKN